MFCYMVAEHLKKGGKALIITDRIELLAQAGKDFEKILEIKAGHEPDLTKNLHVAMIETLARRVERYNNYITTRTMIIIDEAHKCAFNKLFPYLSEKTIVIGATATPLRIGDQPSMDEFYTDMVQCVDTPELIEQGKLSRAKTYGVDIDLKGVKSKGNDYDTDQMAQRYSESKVYEGVIENYNRICPGTKAILFASNRASSKEICLKLNMAGIPAKHLDSDKKLITDKERKEIFKWFKETPGAVLCNIGIATTGFNEPTIETVILYRATKSLTLYLQMVGRGSRTIEGLKDTFNLLDFGNNVKTHNFWEAPRTWSLDKKKKKDKSGVAPIKICPQCQAMLNVNIMACVFCDFAFKKEYGGKNEFAELRLLSPPQIWEHAKKADVKTKAKLAKEKMVKSFAMLHTFNNDEEGKKQGLEFCKEMGYKPEFAFINRHKFRCFESL